MLVAELGLGLGLGQSLNLLYHKDYVYRVNFLVGQTPV